ncbi:MAG: malate dehydrogenase, partial [Nitrosomonadales bacterium]|nr:malate dehydrogenase [Nitrosomonadales bacterium]
GFPVRCKQGEYHIVPDLPISESGRKHMQYSYRELVEEREHVMHLLG